MCATRDRGHAWSAPRAPGLGFTSSSSMKWTSKATSVSLWIWFRGSILIAARMPGASRISEYRHASLPGCANAKPRWFSISRRRVGRSRISCWPGDRWGERSRPSWSRATSSPCPGTDPISMWKSHPLGHDHEDQLTVLPMQRPARRSGFQPSSAFSPPLLRTSFRLRRRPLARSGL